MKWTVNELSQYRSRELEFDEHITVNEMKELNKDIRSISPVHVFGRADVASNNITFDLHIKGEMILPCSRTLADVEFPFDIHTKEIFTLGNSSYELDEDDDIHPTDGEVVDLMPYIRENILLEIPIKVVSNEDGKGKAPQSGKDWEVVSEEQKKDQVDPRLEKLKQFFDDK